MVNETTLDFLAFGEILIDFVGTESGLFLEKATSFEKCAGGAPANVAVGVSRLGRSSGMIAKVGTDPFGDFLIQTLEQEGVQTTGMARSSQARTTLAFVSIGEDGERDFTFFRHPGADTQWRQEELPRDLIRKASVFHFGSLSLTHPDCRETTCQAVEFARSQGVCCSMDPNLRLMLWDQPEEAVQAVWQVLPQAQFLKVSGEELELLTGLSNESRGLEKLRQAGPHVVVLTRGADPCRLHTRDLSRDIPGFSVPAKDSTGAGDSFVAGWWASIFTQGISLSQLADDPEALEKACRFAQAAAALTVQGRGAIPALPTREEVEQFLADMS